MSYIDPIKTKKIWLESIKQWKASGKSVLAWCTENNISSDAFYYRKKALSQEDSHQINIDSFVELPNKTTNFELEIEYKNYKFKLKDFDILRLHDFFKIIKGL